MTLFVSCTEYAGRQQPLKNETTAPLQRRGRGAAENPANRFDRLAVEIDPGVLSKEDQRRAKTEFFRDTTRKILSENNSPDIHFRYGVNPFRGCEHGYVYCDARPTHAYLGFSDGRLLALLETHGVVEPVAWVLEHTDRTFGTTMIEQLGLEGRVEEDVLFKAHPSTDKDRAWHATMRERLWAKDSRALLARSDAEAKQ